MRKCRIGTAKFFTLLLLLYRTSEKNQGIISGGMIPKIECCVEAVRRGVHRTHIVDGRIPHSLLIELFSDEGVGTMFI